MKIPNRRVATTHDLDYKGKRYHLTVGYNHQYLQPMEAFIHGAKVGSEMDALLDSACILLSKLYQSGANPRQVAKSLGGQCLLGAVAEEVARISEERYAS